MKEIIISIKFLVKEIKKWVNEIKKINIDTNDYLIENYEYNKKDA